MVLFASSWLSFPALIQRFKLSTHVYLNLGSRKVNFERFVHVLIWKRLVFSVVFRYKDCSTSVYDCKCKSSQDSMLVFELRKEAVSDSGLSVLCFYAPWLLVGSSLRFLSL